MISDIYIYLNTIHFVQSGIIPSGFHSSFLSLLFNSYTYIVEVVTSFSLDIYIYVVLAKEISISNGDTTGGKI